MFVKVPRPDYEGGLEMMAFLVNALGPGQGSNPFHRPSPIDSVKPGIPQWSGLALNSLSSGGKPPPESFKKPSDAARLAFLDVHDGTLTKAEDIHLQRSKAGGVVRQLVFLHGLIGVIVHRGLGSLRGLVRRRRGG